MVYIDIYNEYQNKFNTVTTLQSEENMKSLLKQNKNTYLQVTGELLKKVFLWKITLHIWKNGTR